MLFRSCFDTGCTTSPSHFYHKISSPAMLLILFIPQPGYSVRLLLSGLLIPHHHKQLNPVFSPAGWARLWMDWSWQVCSFWLPKREVCVLLPDYATGSQTRSFVLACHQVASVVACCVSITKVLPNFAAGQCECLHLALTVWTWNTSSQRNQNCCCFYVRKLVQRRSITHVKE